MDFVVERLELAMSQPAQAGPDAELVLFHDGNRAALERCYVDHFEAVRAAVGRIVEGVDRDTVVHEVFHRLLESRELREHFRGGSMRAWLVTVARNHALDRRRRAAREQLVDDAQERAIDADTAEATEARLLVDRFRQTVLPPRWAPVFEARFLRQLTQREAAQELGMNRTTLAYQELRIRGLLRRFLLRGEEQP